MSCKHEPFDEALLSQTAIFGNRKLDLFTISLLFPRIDAVFHALCDPSEPKRAML